MVGEKKNLEQQMESLPEKHIRRQANQESQVQSFVLNLWLLTQLKSADNKNNCQVLSLCILLQDPDVQLCFLKETRPLT